MKAHKSAADFTSFASHTPEGVDEVNVTGLSKQPYLLDRERILLYTALAGLLDAKVPMEVAIKLVATEFNRGNRHTNAERVSTFFSGMRAARKAVVDRDASAVNDDISSAIPAVDLGSLADECFGSSFTSAEELILLRGLAHTDEVASILRAAAQVVRIGQPEPTIRTGRPGVRNIAS